MIKGGVAKTTTVINLGEALQLLGKKVLLIDADPQASLTEALGILDKPVKSLFTELSKVIKGEAGDFSQVVVQASSGISLVPSSIELAGAELELVSVYGREQIFSWMLEKVKDQYDFILIDCPPAFGMLTVNALVASDYVLIPMQAEFLPLKGLRIFMHHINSINRLNNRLKILGCVLTMYDERRVMSRRILRILELEFGDKLFETHIRNNIQLAKAQEAGTDIFHFDKLSHGAHDYNELAKEFLVKINKN